MKIHPIILTCLFLPVPILAQNSDLPFDSGSNGEDGVLIFGDIGIGGHDFGFAWDGNLQGVVRTGGRRTRSNWSDTRETWGFNQDGWSRISSSGGLPDRGLNGTAIAWDEDRGELVLFGGLIAGNLQYNAIAYGGTRVRNGSSWSNRSPGNSPAGRRDHAMVYDAERKEIVLFGGRDVNNNPFGDTRTWNGSTWTNEAPTPAPSARYSHSMAYDRLRKEVVLFGGTTGGGETWTWNGADWTLETPATSPSTRNNAGMCFDEARGVVVLFGGSSGGNQTWTWDGNDWNQESPNTVPASRKGHRLAYDFVRQSVVMAGKSVSSNSGIDDPESLETWAWDGSDWSRIADKNFTFDLGADPDGIWNFTRISIDNDVTVTFANDAANNSVVWLASEGVNIRGTINLNGNSTTAGPGGFEGGTGGSPGDGSPGSGPDGGAGGTGAGGDGGNAADTARTAFGIPLIGGSGGGGGASNSGSGFSGGGGGGALLIATSKDLEVTGSITARPGARGSGSTAGNGGHAAGGTIRLIGDRILVNSSSIDVTALDPSAPDGRVRLEGYIREFNPGNIQGNLSASVPVEGDLLAQAAGRLRITDVAGNAVAVQPGGDPLNPDVIFGESGDVTITVQGVNIPDSTPVTLTIEHDTAGTIEVPAVNLTGGQAVFTRTIPAGNGTIQAFTTYQVGGN